jgi:hypothetical protein
MPAEVWLAAAVDLAAALAAASAAAVAATVVVADTGNPGLERKTEFPLIDKKARLLRQAGFFVGLEKRRWRS